MNIQPLLQAPGSGWRFGLRWAAVALLLLCALPHAWAAALTRTPSELPVVITFRHPQTQAVTTERFIWQEKRFAEEQYWPILDVGRNRNRNLDINSLLPTELNTRDPEGVVITPVPGEPGLWQRGRSRYRFRFAAFTIESPQDRQPDIADRASHEAEDLGLGDILAELDDEEDGGARRTEAEDGVREVVLRSPISLPGGRLALENIDRIVIPYPRGWDGRVRGRYLRYHQSWTGTGKVQPLRASFIGSAGDDDLVGGDFLPDGRIVAFGNIADPAALANWRPRQLGRDPGVDAEITVTIPQGRRTRTVQLEQRAPYIIRFDEDLGKVEAVLRLPLRTATARRLQVEADGQITVLLATRSNIEEFLNSLPVLQRVAPLEDRDPNFGSLILRLNQNLEVSWGVFMPGRGVSIGPRPGEDILVWAGSQFWTIAGDGAVRDGPSLAPGRVGNTVSCGVTGAIVSTGYFDQSTGREPWKRPHWRKWNAEGGLEMILYGWPGPLVGLDVLRQVSDALNYRGDFDHHGNFFLYARHDGGNVVAANVPYDLMRYHNKYGALRDMSAASLGSFTSLLHIDMESYDVLAATYSIGYHPIFDYPTSGTVHNAAMLGDGRIAVAGATAYGLLESQDSWYPNFLAQREDPEVEEILVRGGSYLKVLSPDMQRMIFSTVLPNNGYYQVAARGSRLLLTARVGAEVSVYGDMLAPITKEPVQAGYGGGATDGWIMLVETEGAQ